MKKVWIEDDCVACGACVEICPEVFKMDDDIAEVREDADLSLDNEIEEAADDCPVDVIHFEK